MSKTKTKARAIPAAQSRDEVEAAIGRMGDLQRETTRIQADFGDKAAALKAEAERELEPIVAELDDLRTRVQGWCEAHRAELTQGERVKYHAFPTGEVKWRIAPPKVSIRGVDAVLEQLKRLGLDRFIRVKEEPNKEAMLAEPDLARSVAGVSIASAGEDFVIEPFQPELAGAAA